MLTPERSYNISLLFDFYGELLSDRQKEVLDLYFNEDLSLSEISENTGITRQGVRDAIKKAEAILQNYEEKLGLIKRFDTIGKDISFVLERLSELKANGNVYVDDLIEKTQKIKDSLI